jgi:hypothetical protein
VKAVVCRPYGPPQSLIIEEILERTPEALAIMADRNACGKLVIAIDRHN